MHFNEVLSFFIRTPLHLAVKSKNIDIFKIILANNQLEINKPKIFQII